jgi:hypothetical protein
MTVGTDDNAACPAVCGDITTDADSACTGLSSCNWCAGECTSDSCSWTSYNQA